MRRAHFVFGVGGQRLGLLEVARGGVDDGRRGRDVETDVHFGGRLFGEPRERWEGGENLCRFQLLLARSGKGTVEKTFLIDSGIQNSEQVCLMIKTDTEGMFF